MHAVIRRDGIEQGRSAFMFFIFNPYFGRHARTQLRQGLLIVIELDAHAETAGNFSEIAAGIIRRDQGKFRAAGWRKSNHGSF